MLKPLSEHAIAYTVAHLMRVAAPTLSYKLRVEGEVYPVAAVVETTLLSIRLLIMPPERWAALTAGSLRTVQVPTFDQKETIPLFLEKGKSFAQWQNGTLTIHADVITLSFLLLSRGEELLIDQRDEFGRFRYAWSLSKMYGIIDVPVVDEWGMLLRQELCKVYSSQELGANTPALTPTHDMDTARRFSSLPRAIGTILGGDILRYRNLRMAADSLRHYLMSYKHPELDPELLGAEKLLDVSKQYGLRSEFYFMGISEGEDDFRYDVTAPALVSFAQKARSCGMVCGFHGSRGTSDSLAQFQKEQHRVGRAIGYLPNSGRQHYLCFDVVKTPAIWTASGIYYDSTLGYADREGFRCGTSISYPLYDLVSDRPLDVIERPLIVMDGTLQGYRGLSTKDALSSMKRLFNRCCAVGGDFVMLWHNGNVMRNWAEWYQEVYLSFVPWASEQLRKEALPNDQ